MRKGDGDLGMINSDMIISFSLSRAVVVVVVSDHISAQQPIYHTNEFQSF
jgi:hypothetical protein